MEGDPIPLWLLLLLALSGGACSASAGILGASAVFWALSLFGRVLTKPKS